MTRLCECHIAKKTLKNRVLAEGHIVPVYKEKRPSQMWRLGRIVELICRKDQHICSAVVQVYNNCKTVNSQHLIKLLYPVKLKEESPKEPIDISGPQLTSVMDEHIVDIMS